MHANKHQKVLELRYIKPQNVFKVFIYIYVEADGTRAEIISTASAQFIAHSRSVHILANLYFSLRHLGQRRTLSPKRLLFQI